MIHLPLAERTAQSKRRVRVKRKVLSRHPLSAVLSPRLPQGVPKCVAGSPTPDFPLASNTGRGQELAESSRSASNLLFLLSRYHAATPTRNSRNGMYSWRTLRIVLRIRSEVDPV